MDAAVLIQVLIGGVLLGGLYALVAFGLSLIYGVARILNFAHGTLLAVGGVAGSVIYAKTGWQPVVIILVLMPVYFLFGWVFYDTALRPLAKRSPFEAVIGTVLVTVGALIILSDIAALLAGPTPKKIQVDFEMLEFGEVLLSTTQLYILIGIAALTAILHVLLKKTWFGRAMRAVTQDATGAAICGVRASIINSTTFAFGSAIVAIAAVPYAMLFPIDPYAGFALTVKAFTIIILGGVGNLAGALAAGLFLGIAEAFTAFFWAPEWAPALSIILLIVILIVFPTGIFARRNA
jgi:branched-chain amino acid transport system permease protein